MIFPHDMSHPHLFLKIFPPIQKIAIFQSPKIGGIFRDFSHYFLPNQQSEPRKKRRSWAKRPRPWDWWPLRPCPGPVVSTTGARQPRCWERRRDKKWPKRCRKSREILENCRKNVKIAQKAGKSWKRTRKFGQFLVGVAIVASLQLAFHIISHIWICPTDGGRSHLSPWNNENNDRMPYVPWFSKTIKDIKHDLRFPWKMIENGIGQWLFPQYIPQKSISNMCFPRFFRALRLFFFFFFEESIGAAVVPPVKQTKMDVILKLQGLVFGGFWGGFNAAFLGLKHL